MAEIRSRTDTLPVAVILSLVGGFLDAYTFVRHAVFANLQSGNVVLFCVQATAGHWPRALLSLIPIGAFFAGVLGVEILGLPWVKGLVRRPVRLVLTIQIVLLAAIACLPADAPAPATTVIVSFVAAMQFSTFTTLREAPYANLMASGNMRTSISAAHQWLAYRNAEDARRAGRYAIVVGAFALGAAVGAILTRALGTPAIAVAAVLLASVLALLIAETRQLERGA